MLSIRLSIVLFALVRVQIDQLSVTGVHSLIRIQILNY